MEKFTSGVFMTIQNRKRYYWKAVLRRWQQPGNPLEIVLQPVIKTKLSLFGQQFEHIILFNGKKIYTNLLED